MEASALHHPLRADRPGGRARLLRMRSDEQLLSLFRLGDDDAFSALHDRYRGRLVAYAQRMLGGSRSDAEDAVQDVFLRAYRVLGEDARPVAIRAWLYRVAHNRCVDQLRRTAPDPAEVLRMSAGTDTDGPAAIFERREDMRRVLADIGALPEAQRSALLLREMEGLTYEELCTTLGTTMPAVKSLLVRARSTLAEVAQARGLACRDVRRDLAVAHDAGIRPDACLRRHVRECEDCRSFSAALGDVPAAHGAHTGPLGALAKLLGLTGAPAAGGAAVAGGTAVSAKIAALACCGLMAGIGGIVEVPQLTGGDGGTHHRAPAHARGADTGARTTGLHQTVARPAGAAADAPRRRAATDARPAPARPRIQPVVAAPVAPTTPTTGGTDSASAEPATGGAGAPDDAVDAPDEPVTVPAGDPPADPGGDVTPDPAQDTGGGGGPTAVATEVPATSRPGPPPR